MRVNDATAPDLETLVGDWLTVPDLAEALGMSLRQVRQMIADREIIASRVGERNVVAVPAAFIQGGGVLASLMGTVTVLNDGGFDDDEAIRWLCTPDETLRSTGHRSTCCARAARPRCASAPWRTRSDRELPRQNVRAVVDSMNASSAA